MRNLYNLEKLQSFPSNSGGRVFKGYSSSDLSTSVGGEMYFSSVPFGVWKEWRVHERSETRMIVIRGPVTVEVRPRLNSRVTRLSIDEMTKLTLSLGVWFRFKGDRPGEESLICNLSQVARSQSAVSSDFQAHDLRSNK